MMLAPTHAPTFTDDDKDAIKSRLDGCDVFERLTGLQGRPTPGGRIYCNPFVHQNTPSFKVFSNPEEGFYDFATREVGGDVFSLIAFVEKLDRYLDWVRVLRLAADLAGYTATGAPFVPQRLPPKPAARDITPILLSDSWQTVITGILADTQGALWRPNGAKSLAWLRGRIDAGRGLPTEQIDQLIRDCRIDYLPETRDTGLRDESGKPIRVWAGLLFPYFDRHGAITALQVRVGKAAGKVAQTHKYLFVSGSKPTANPFIAGRVFNPDAPAVITESVIKTLAIKIEYPDWNCIGVGSAGYSLTDPMIDLLRHCPTVYLAMDNDPNDKGHNPGQEANARLASAINTSNVKLCIIPFGKDPDGFIKEGGQLADLFADAQPYTPPMPRRKLSNNERKGLNTHAQSAAIAPTLELFFGAWAANLIDPSKGVTLAELRAYAQTLDRGTSAACIERGVREGAKWGFFECWSDDSTGGRPAKRYTTDLDRIQAAILKAAEMNLEDRLAERDNVVPTPTLLHMDNALADENPDPGTLHPDAEHIAVDLAGRYADVLIAQPGSAGRYECKRRELKRLADSLKDTQTADLPKDCRFKNAREYKAAFFRGLVDSGQLTDWQGKPTESPGNKRIAELIGASPRVVGSLAKKAGIDLKPQTAERLITDADYLENPPAYDKAVKGALRELRFADGSGGSIDNSNVRREAARRASMGEGITGVFQMASKVEKVTAIPPDPLPETNTVKTSPTLRRETIPFMARGLRVLLRLATLAGVARRMGDDLQDLATGEYAPLTARNVIGLLQGEGIKQPYQFDVADVAPLTEVDASLAAEAYGAQPATADNLPAEVGNTLPELAQWLTRMFGGSVKMIDHDAAKRALEVAAHEDEHGLEGVIDQLDRVARNIADCVLADPRQGVNDQSVTARELRQIDDYLCRIRCEVNQRGGNAFNVIRTAIVELDQAAVDLLRGSNWARFVPDGAGM